MPDVDCAIFDLDGTIADVRHRLHLIKGGGLVQPNWPAFFDACKDDTPIEYVVRLNHILFRNLVVFIASVRPDSHREVTVQCLAKWKVRYHHLMMRKAKDYRDDTEVKKEMLDKIRGMGFNPVFSIDDRPEVVKMWRRNGVPCFVVDDEEWHA